ncbi:hypothetical protein [Coleofasciculus sp. E2-BRE-01]|uniref:hypothetical protein n=1 Tax=Coleofasciculus sp. E2-BRE-01 TaxID=3069524 RepID=UPI0040648AF2
MGEMGEMGKMGEMGEMREMGEMGKMGEMGEMRENKGRMSVILHLLGNSQSCQLFDIIEKEPLLGSVVKALWW